jgi:hypothetical protein
MRYKIIGAPKKFKKMAPSPIYLGLELTIYVIKSQLHLVRQSLSMILTCVGASMFVQVTFLAKGFLTEVAGERPINRKEN